MASSLFTTPHRLVEAVRHRFSRSVPTPEVSSSSDSDSTQISIPVAMLESHSAKIRAKYPSASENWVRNKAVNKLKKMYKDEFSKQVTLAFNADSSDGSDYDVLKDTLMVKTPLGRANFQLYHKQKEILQAIDCPEKLSNILLNPIEKVDRLRLISKFMKDFEKSTLSRQRTRSTAFQMAMIHTELAVIHQLIIDRIHSSKIRTNNRWAFKTCFDTSLTFVSSQAEIEAHEYMEEFRTEFDQLLRLTQMLQPSRKSVLSFQEVMGILVYLSQDEDTMESWPLTLATGSQYFGEFYTNMLDSSFTPQSAKRRYETMNTAKKRRSPDSTARKNASLLESLHTAAKPNHEVIFTEEEQAWLKDLTLTYHPDTQEMPCAPILPPSFSDSTYSIEDDALCDLLDLVWQYDLTKVPYVDLIQHLNRAGANITINPAHARVIVDISCFGDYTMVRFGDIMAICNQALDNFDAVYRQPPQYTPGPALHTPSIYNQNKGFRRSDFPHTDPRTSTHHPFSMGTPVTPPPTCSPITNTQSVKPKLHPDQINATTAIYPILPRNAGHSKRANILLDEIASIKRRIEFERSKTLPDDHASYQKIQSMMEQHAEKTRELYDILGVPTDDKGAPVTEEKKEDTSSKEITALQRQIADMSDQIKDLSITLDNDRVNMLNSQESPSTVDDLDDYKKFYQPLDQASTSSDVLSLMFKPVNPRRGRPPTRPAAPVPPTPNTAARTLAEQLQRAAGEEGLKRARDAYKAIKPFSLNDDADSFIRRVQALIPRFYPEDPIDAVKYDLIFAKCDDNIQTLILKNDAITQGDVKALKEFLLTKAGKTPTPEKDLVELKRSSGKKSWREIILLVENAINAEHKLHRAKPDIISTQLQYRKAILEFCDATLRHDLRLRGLIQKNNVKYAEFCEFLLDLDDEAEQINTRDVRFARIIDEQQADSKSLTNTSQLVRTITKTITDALRPNSGAKRSKSEHKVNSADTSNRTYKQRSQSWGQQRNQSQYNPTGPSNGSQRQQSLPRTQRQSSSQPQLLPQTPVFTPQQPNPDFKPNLQRQNAFRQSRRSNRDDEASPPAAAVCDLCNVKDFHFITHCPRLIWFERVTPLPEGINSSCNPFQYCFASGPTGRGCTGRGHYTRYCTNYEYKVKQQSF